MAHALDNEVFVNVKAKPDDFDFMLSKDKSVPNSPFKRKKKDPDLSLPSIKSKLSSTL